MYVAAGYLVKYGMLGLLVTMPPALLLGLGLKQRGRWTKGASGAMFLFLGTALLGLVVQGVITGEVLAWSRSTLMVLEEDRPLFFWLSAFGFSVVSLLAMGLGVFLAWSALANRGGGNPHD